jgi:hypothetical protein
LIADLSPIKNAPRFELNRSNEYKEYHTHIFLAKINTHVTRKKLSNKSVLDSCSATELYNQFSDSQNTNSSFCFKKLLDQYENNSVFNSIKG